MTSILLASVYLAVVLVIFWSVYAERLPSYRDRGPFTIRRSSASPVPDQKPGNLPGVR